MTSSRLEAFSAVFLSLGLASCSTFGGSSPSSDSGGGSMFRNLFVYGGTTVPPSMTEEKKLDCPQTVIRDGGAVLRNGKGQAVSSQLTIRNLVRECAEDGDGLTVKVGIEGIALIGTAGKPGPVSGPIKITVDRDGKTLSTRATVAKVTVGPDGNESFAIVEDGIKVPPGDGETIINVGFKN